MLKSKDLVPVLPSLAKQMNTKIIMGDNLKVWAGFLDDILKSSPRQEQNPERERPCSSSVVAACWWAVAGAPLTGVRATWTQTARGNKQSKASLSVTKVILHTQSNQWQSSNPITALHHQRLLSLMPFCHTNPTPYLFRGLCHFLFHISSAV